MNAPVAPPTTRRKRFVRPAEPAPIEVTARDIDILARVARRRFLSSEHLEALDGGSPQNLRRRLRGLYDHGYLDRPHAQRTAPRAGTPRPFVYGLTTKGARVLREYGFLLNAGVDWNEKNKRAGAIFIEHTLAIADVLTRLEVACRAREGVSLIEEQTILAAAPEATRRSRMPLRWMAQHGEERLCVVPDGVFGLLHRDGSASYFLLELDRGTIPITRERLHHKSISAKLRAYYEGWRQDRHVKQFGVKQLRVAFVTTVPGRVENMLKAAEAVTEGRGTNFFLFIDRRRLAAGDPLEVPWTTGKRQGVRLVD